MSGKQQSRPNNRLLKEKQMKMQVLLPVTTTSVSISPFIKLRYLFPGSSIPRPYEGKGSTRSQWDGSWQARKACVRIPRIEHNKPKFFIVRRFFCIYLFTRNRSNKTNEGKQIRESKQWKSTWDPRMTAPFSRKSVRWLVRLKLPVSHFPGGT